jgi:erythrocyte band 7 integral membrane protein
MFWGHATWLKFSLRGRPSPTQCRQLWIRQPTLGALKVERVEMKDVRLPLQLQRAMAAEAEAARARVIAAEGEMKASRALKEASDVIAESPAALQLRYLQTLNTISAEKNSTIIFPLPLDIVTPFLGSLTKNK